MAKTYSVLGTQICWKSPNKGRPTPFIGIFGKSWDFVTLFQPDPPPPFKPYNKDKEKVSIAKKWLLVGGYSVFAR